MGFLLYFDGVPAGLAAIADHGNSRYEVCDFYVVPVFRKNKAGQRFAHSLFSMMPGEWVSKQIEARRACYRFLASLDWCLYQ